MNLKEAFRYQNFLDGLMTNATQAIGSRTAALTVTKVHKRKAVNPEAEDITEVVDKGECHKPEDILAVMQRLITERTLLSQAITRAKTGMKDRDGHAFDMDSALETVKFQRSAAAGIRSLLNCKASKGIDSGRDYKFNVEGNQVSYVYEIETTITEDFDRKNCRDMIKNLLSEADKMSSVIEKMQVDTPVDYNPPFDVNDNFDEVVEQIAGE